MEDGQIQTVPKKAHVWKRDRLDWYVEPIEATRALLDRERFIGGIWDPACGQGNIVKACVERGYTAWGSDLVERGLVPTTIRDFLNDWPAADTEALAANIICNPPFFKAKGAEAFVRRALELVHGKVCMFLDIRFLAGHKRATGLFLEHPPHRVWIVTPRVSCPPGDYLAAGNKAGGGSADWCWFVWDQTSPATTTTLQWMRIK